jgi:hypothetical protein
VCACVPWGRGVGTLVLRVGDVMIGMQQGRAVLAAIEAAMLKIYASYLITVACSELCRAAVRTAAS